MRRSRDLRRVGTDPRTTGERGPSWTNEARLVRSSNRLEEPSRSLCLLTNETLILSVLALLSNRLGGLGQEKFGSRCHGTGIRGKIAAIAH